MIIPIVLVGHNELNYVIILISYCNFLLPTFNLTTLKVYVVNAPYSYWKLLRNYHFDPIWFKTTAFVHRCPTSTRCPARVPLVDLIIFWFALMQMLKLHILAWVKSVVIQYIHQTKNIQSKTGHKPVIAINSLRPSDAYMRQWTFHPWLR